MSRLIIATSKSLYPNLFKSTYKSLGIIKCLATNTEGTETESTKSFETVFSFPFVKYFAIFNRIKMYHIAASCIVIPSSGLLEWFSLLPQGTFLSASYVGVTAGCLLSIASLPFTNVIGFLYINQDNSQIKISAVDFWGQRKDVIIQPEDWTPLSDLPRRTLDAIYLRPRLANGTKYTFFQNFGKIHDSLKISQVLE